MTTELDLAYIAGLMDGEAYIGVKKTPAYRCQDRITPGYIARIQIRMVDEPAIRFVAETFGGWYYLESPRSARGRPLYCYQASHQKAEDILVALLPYLKVKKNNALAVLSLRMLKDDRRKYQTKITGYRDFPNKYGTARRIATCCYSDAYIALCDEIYQHCKALNHGKRS